MIKKEFNYMKNKYENVNYSPRYGYWWKQYKKIASKIKDYSPAIDYFHDMQFKLDAPMSHKHFERWRR